MDKLSIGKMLTDIRKHYPNAVAREDSNGLYFDLTGNEFPEDPILDISHNVYIKD